MHGLVNNPSSTIEACHPFNININDYRVLGVCNGLVCLLASHRYKYEEEYWVRFWNPATRVMSQDSPCIPLERFRVRSGFGFGHDDWSDTYQVVVLDTKPQKTEVKVHRLGDTGWKTTLTCNAFPILSLDAAASVSGTVNWLALPNSGSDYRWETVTINDLVIFSYDPKDESLRYLSLPHGPVDEVLHISPELDVLKGCLCLSHLSRHDRDHFGFWLMKEFGVEESWTHLLNVSCEQIDIDGRGLLYAFPDHLRILCMSEDDDVVLLENEGHWKLSLYNKRDNTTERYEDWGRLKFLSYDYVQSLVMPYRN